MEVIFLVGFTIGILCTVGHSLEDDVYELSVKAGYIAEPHDVVTQDGYILTIFRIITPSDTFKTLAKKEPLLLQHGLSGSAEHFTSVGNESTAYFLTRENYDVWLGNSRGSFHSLRHKTLSTDSIEFWKFTMDQHGRYDLPAMLDYILNTTNRENLSFIGHSQGSGMFYTMTAGDLPEYNKKVKIHVSLAPAVYLKHIKLQVARYLSFILPLARAFLEYVGVYVFPAIFKFPLLQLVFDIYCGNTRDIKVTCPQLISIVEPVNQELLNTDYIPVFIKTQPAGMSIYQLLLLGQFIFTGKFSRYDWGPKENLKFYKKSKAAAYNLSQVVAPVALIYGKNDGLVAPQYELAANAGYLAEPHDVVTEDGYIITIFRIFPQSGTNATLARKKPVLVQHGIMGSGETYAQARNDSLAFFLCDESFDVWLGNARGNIHGQRHKKYTVSSKQFWKFSMDQVGQYDYPAIIDYILNITNRPNLTVIAHSQGSTQFFTMLAGSRPEYNEKVNIHIALAPGVYMTHTLYPLIRLIRGNVPLFREIYNKLGIDHLDGVVASPSYKRIVKMFCGGGPFLSITCSLRTMATEPVSHQNIEWDYYPQHIETTPSSYSIAQLLQVAQWSHTGVFARYDWGPVLNKKFYNSPDPPVYRLSQVKTKVAIFHSVNDGQVVLEDIYQLADELPNVVDNYRIPNKYFTHMDFLLGKNLRNLYYNHLLELLHKYSK